MSYAKKYAMLRYTKCYFKLIRFFFLCSHIYLYKYQAIPCKWLESAVLCYSHTVSACTNTDGINWKHKSRCCSKTSPLLTALLYARSCILLHCVLILKLCEDLNFIFSLFVFYHLTFNCPFKLKTKSSHLKCVTFSLKRF